MEITPVIAHRFVKCEDMNHHSSLYAARAAEWFVEAGLMAAAACVPSAGIVCVQLHGMTFTRPVRLGEVVKFVSKVVYAGRTSLIANIRMYSHDEMVINGFITFVNTDEQGKPLPHGVRLEAVTPEDIELQAQAAQLHAVRH